MQYRNEILDVLKRNEAEKWRAVHLLFSAMDKVFILIGIYANNYKLTIYINVLIMHYANKYLVLEYVLNHL